MNISLNAFNNYVVALAAHDWYFEYSDDSRVYRSGRESQKQLTSQASTNPLLQDTYSLYSASVMSSTGSLLQRIESREQAIDKLRNQVISLQCLSQLEVA